MQVVFYFLLCVCVCLTRQLLVTVASLTPPLVLEITSNDMVSRSLNRSLMNVTYDVTQYQGLYNKDKKGFNTVSTSFCQTD